jgi:hypothetical protein
MCIMYSPVKHVVGVMSHKLFVVDILCRLQPLTSVSVEMGIVLGKQVKSSYLVTGGLLNTHLPYLCIYITGWRSSSHSLD